MRASVSIGLRFAAVIVSAFVTAGCGQHDAGTGGPSAVFDPSAVQVVAFNSAEPGWAATVPAFAATPEGKGITLAPNFGTSTEQVQAVLAGKPADIVHLAHEADMAALVRAGLVSPDWNSGPAAGVPCGSIVTWVVRKGNPLHIAQWNDLLQPGLDVITPSPMQVGSGRWALLAAYAAASNGNKDPQAGQEYLRRLILEHVVQGPTTIQSAIDEFTKGRGDVLLLSETAAMNLTAQGQPFQYIVPPQTLQMDFPVAVLRAAPHADAAKRTVDFLFSDAGQRLWAQQGYRPTNPGIAAEFATRFPTPQRLWTIADLGGWGQLGPRLFDTTNGYVTILYNQATQ